MNDFFDFTDEFDPDYADRPDDIERAETFATLMIPDDAPAWLQPDDAPVQTKVIPFPRRSAYGGYPLSKQRRAMIISDFSRKRGVERMRQFVIDGIAWWVFDREEMWADLAADSFEAWLADPENKIGHGTTYGTDAVQSIDLFHKFFRIKASKMFGVGWAKFQIINPQVEKLRAEVELAREQWAVQQLLVRNMRANVEDQPDLVEMQQLSHHEHRLADYERIADELFRAHKARAEAWLLDAQNLSVRDLKAEIESDPENGGWQTYFSSPVMMKTLKEMTASEMLAFFGIASLPDDYSVIIEVKGKRFEGLL